MVWRIVPGEPCPRSMVVSHSWARSSVEIVSPEIIDGIVPGDRLGMIGESWGSSSLMINEVTGATVVESGLWEHRI